MTAKCVIKENGQKVIEYYEGSTKVKEVPYPEIGQGPAQPATTEDLARDEVGFTNPNLHRRVDPQLTDFNYSAEFKPRSYQFQIQGYNSYRTTSIHTHDEDATELVDGRDVEIT